jgi:hypothetical protein
MSDSTEILVLTDQSLKDLVKTLSDWFQFSFMLHREDKGTAVRYESLYEYTRIVVIEQDYLTNDRELHFEDYRYKIGVSTRGYESWQEDERRRREISRRIFEHLKATDHYRLLMVENVQSFVDEYTPESSQPSVLMLKARTLPSDISLYVGSAPSPEILYQDLKDSFQAQGLEVSQGAREGHFLLPIMSVSVGRVRKMVTHDTIAKTSKEVSLAPAGFSYEIYAQARVQLPGGLAVPGERRSWVSELMTRLFEHLKVLGRYRLVLRDEAEDRELVAFDPDAAEQTP